MNVPIVDDLTLQILVDNATFGPFLPNQSLPGLTVTRFTGDNRARMSPDALRGEFGLSILARSTMDGVHTGVLVDFGYTAGALINNAKLLGVDLSSIDAALLSHGHLDHYGGFSALPARSGRIPLYVGGEEVFCERIAMIATPPLLMGALDRAALAAAGFDVRIASEPAIVGGQSFSSGTIPLLSTERTAIPTAMRPGRGCDRTALGPQKADAAEIVDDGAHELALYYAVKDLGLVVISCCSHRGVLNAIRRAQSISGIDKVHAVVGGFHLVRPRTEAEARATAATMAEIGPRYVIPMHCSGEVFIQEAERLMPGRVIRPYVGTELRFAI